MSKKFLFVDGNGDYCEAEAFEVTDHIDSSAGAGDAGKPIITDSNGQIDPSFINFGSIDHGSLSGLLDDDHTQYILVDGTRAFTGDQSLGNNLITNLNPGIAGTDAVNVNQLNNAVQGIDWKESARVGTDGSNINLASAPATIDGVTLNNGDRVLVKDQSILSENGIYIFNGAGSAMTRSADADEDSEVTAMMTVGVAEGTVNADRVYTVTSNDPLTVGTSDIVFGLLPVNTFVAGDGIDIVGSTISADLLASGGLKFVSGELAVEPADFAGEGLIDDGSDNLAIDWSTTFNDAKAVKAEDLNSTTNGEGASIIGVEDASGYYTGSNVEAILDELESQIGGNTSSTYDFTENNVLADNDAIYAALEKLDLKHGDYASNANGEGASLIGIEDAAGNFTATDVEGALTELYNLASDEYDQEIANAGANINSGDLVFFSANDTVSPMPINTNNYSVGVAIETVTLGNPVKFATADAVATGVLTGATAGQKYFWDGTNLTSTIPATTGSYVWQAGIAKNATDLLIKLEFVKKNA